METKYYRTPPPPPARDAIELVRTDPDVMREFLCVDHPEELIMANAFAIGDGRIPVPRCRACGKELQRPANLGRSPLIGPKYELGYPVSDVSTYYPDGAERERVRDTVKQNSTRPLVSLDKRVEKELLKEIRE